MDRKLVIELCQDLVKDGGSVFFNDEYMHCQSCGVDGGASPELQYHKKGCILIRAWKILEEFDFVYPNEYLEVEKITQVKE